MTLFPWVFIRKSARERYTDKVDRHETTHALQQAELLFVLFYLIYGMEYLLKLLITFSHKKAYKSVSLEQEAYGHENEENYNSTRRHYAWVKYVFRLYNK